MNEKLKIGLMIDSTNVPYWVYSMIDKITQSNYAKIELVIINGNQIPKNSFYSKMKNNRDYFLYKIYTKLENKMYKPESDVFGICDLTNELLNTKKITVIPKQTKYSDWIESEDIHEILKNDLDVIVRLGFRILKGDILKAAKCGVWSFHHGDNDVNRGGPAGFWEVFQNNPVTGSVLQIINDELDDGKILAKSYSTTDPILVKRNCNNYYNKTLSFLPRKLKELHELGKDQFLEKVEEQNKNIKFYSNRLYTKPTNTEFLKMSCYNFGKFLKRNLKNSYSFEQWGLLFDIKNEISKSMWRYKKILPPKDRFWADPHIISMDKNYFIFIEEYVYSKSKGHIALIKMDKEGNYDYLGKILEKDYHLSYPFVFQLENNFYMIPETESNNNIELYKCTDFPKKWEYHGEIMNNVNAVDTTIFNYNDKWWMFTGMKENLGKNTINLLQFVLDKVCC